MMLTTAPRKRSESAATARHLPAPARRVTFSPLSSNTVGKYLDNVGREISHWKARSSGAYQGPLVQILGQLR